MRKQMKKLVSVVAAAVVAVTAIVGVVSTGADDVNAGVVATQKAGDIYVSPAGTGDGSSKTSPTSLTNAISKVAAGNTIWMTAGTYSLGSTIMIPESNAGTASAMKTIAPLDGAVVLDFSSMALASSNRGIVLDGSYWHVYGITIKGAGDNGILLSGDNNIIEMCVFKENRDTGLQISRYQGSYNTIAQWPTGNLVKNCTSYDNCDADGENADGFAAKLTCGEGNVFDGCMAYNNSDDGWDLFAKTATGPIGVVTIRNCVAFRNGKLTSGAGTSQGDMNGFKLGGQGVGTPHIVENCLAFENGACGFVDNNNPTAITLKNCTSFDNSKYASGKANFTMYREKGGINSGLLSVRKSSTLGSDSFVGTIANSIYYTNSKFYYVSSTTSIVKGDKKGTTKSVTTSDFVSVTAPGTTTDFHTVWRNADGSINTKGFLEVKSTSPLATLGNNGGVLGCQLSDVSAPDKETETSTEKESPKETETSTEKESPKETEQETPKETTKEPEQTTNKENESSSQLESEAQSESESGQNSEATTEKESQKEPESSSLQNQTEQGTVPAGNESEGDKDNSSGGMIAIVVGILAVTGIAGGITFVFLKKKNKE